MVVQYVSIYYLQYLHTNIIELLENSIAVRYWNTEQLANYLPINFNSALGKTGNLLN